MSSNRSHFPQCLITGCKLVLTNEDAVLHGDLHKVAGTYVFNAVLARGSINSHKDYGQSWKDVFDDQRLNVVAVDGNFAFERRGMIVFPGSAATLNKAALAYVAYAKEAA